MTGFQEGLMDLQRGLVETKQESMVERVAAAICKNSNEYCFWREEFGSTTCATCTLQASVVIEAMREPTEAMLVAKGVQTNCPMCGGHTEGWRLLIDAALKE